MRRIVSVSIGSSKRDHKVEIDVAGETYGIERVGTDGSLDKAVKIIRSLDGKVDAFGMGGIDLYLWAGKKPYIIRDALKLKNAAIKTPIVDGSGLKNTIERRCISYLQREQIIDFRGRKILITSAMDRFGMAETLKENGADLVIGDFMFGLGINMPLYSLEKLHMLSKVVAPIVCKLPFKWLYPTGDQQDTTIESRFKGYYNAATIVAGDFHYIKRNMPREMKDKILITNTLTQEDLLDLKKRGVALVITTTPKLEGRSFGTNVMEALMVSILRRRGKVGTVENYGALIQELKLTPRIEYLQKVPDVISVGTKN